ncbi:MAG TPA: PQQ-dependent sugar dehydrogenase [Pyrinomonadaceae bacterium]|jgi:glucose/arabinose dehydrogenase|nr:PQQ-dependent sugar dehydrogenase [Pyrinomonadaceae bacterium]
MRGHTLRALACAFLFLAACGRPGAGGSAASTGGAGSSNEGGEQSATEDASKGFRVETVIGNLEVPWSIVFAPDGRMFFTERPGRVRVFEGGKLRPEPVAVIPDVEPTGESGLMGLTLHPQFAQNHLLYLAYAYKSGGEQLVRVLRFREANAALADRKVIIENVPAAQFHAGTRMRFGPDGKLYVTTGDATTREIAQQLNSLGGKVLRLNDDGTVPPDNPFVGQAGARPEIWTYGHRNGQGLDFQPGTNLLFETEHGPSGFDGPGGGDEVNIIERGKNYGWPVVHHRDARAGMESPLLEYTPACAPASGAFYRGNALKQFNGNFFFGCLRGEGLQRVVLDGRRVVSQERLFEHRLGRIRDVTEGPDGALYFSTSNRDGRGSPARDDDRIMRLVPQR